MSVASERIAMAQQQATRFEEMTAHADIAIHIDPLYAEQYLLGCISIARIPYERDRREQAHDYLLTCRAKARNVVIDTAVQPPYMVELLNQIDNELATRGSHSLTVSTVNGVACDVMVNGTTVGVTGRPIHNIPEGEIWVELACPDRIDGHVRIPMERVHPYVISGGDLAVQIDTELDWSLVAENGYVVVEDDSPILFFADSETYRMYVATGDMADTIGIATGVSQVWLIRTSNGRTDINVYDVTTHAPLCSALFNPEDSQQIETAIRALLRGESIDLFHGARLDVWRTHQQITAEQNAREARERHQRESARVQEDKTRVLGIAGWSVIGIGGALTGSAIATGIWHFDLGQHNDFRESTFSTSRTYSYASGTLGISLMTAGVPLVLPDTNGEFPLLSLMAIVPAGVNIGVGAHLISIDAPCMRSTDGLCTSLTQSTAPLGTLLLESSAPLLAIPITYAIRAAIGPRLLPHPPTVSITSTPESASLVVSGAF